MPDRARGMGRGLAAILSVPAAPEGDELADLPVDAISANPDQPRRRFEEEGLTSLAASLRETGMLQPVLVRPVDGGGYQLIAGERRWRAARLAGLSSIPAIVRASGDAATLELALVENMAREDLNPVDQARACAALVEELGLTREAVGLRVGRSRVGISNLLRLLELPDDVLDLLESGSLSEGHGRALLTAAAHDDRRRLGRSAAEHGWSVRELEARARRAGGGEPAARPRRAAASHPDQQAAIEQLSDALGRTLGRDVSVRPRAGGYRATIDLDSPQDADELVRRLTSS